MATFAGAARGGGHVFGRADMPTPADGCGHGTRSRRAGGIMAIAWLCLGVLTGCPRQPQQQAPQPAPVEAEGLTVALQQDGRGVPIVNGQAQLVARPFTMVLSFPDVRRAKVMVNASLRPTLWEAVRLGRPAGSVLPLSKQALQEPLQNPHQRIFLTDGGYNYWYFLSEKIHRFDAVAYSGGRYICRREIACYAADRQSPSRPISTLSGSTVYLTFVQQALDPTGGKRVETRALPLRMLFR